MKTILILAALFSGSAFAAQEVHSYACTLRVFAKDLKNGFDERKFDRPVTNGTHGGGTVDLHFGAHTVSIIADGKWRSVSWWRNDVLVAASVNAGAQIYSGPHAVVLYNPANTDEQVSLDCDPVFKQP